MKLDLAEKIRILGKHGFGIRLVMLQPSAFNIFQPGLTFTPRLTAVIEFFQSVNRQRQRRQSLADLLLNARGLLTRQPFISPVRVAIKSSCWRKHETQFRSSRHSTAASEHQDDGKNAASRPFGAVQTHHFFVRQYKFQLAPYQTALTVNRQ